MSQALKALVLTALCFLIPVLIIKFVDGRENFLIEFIFILIILQSVVFIFFIGGMLFKVYATFSYFFFGFVPYLEYKKNIVYWGGETFSDSTYMLANITLLLANFIFLFVYKISRGNKKLIFKKIAHEKINLNNWKAFFAILIMVLSSVFVALYLNNFSLISLLVRGGEFKEMAVETSPVLSVISTFFRAFAMFACMFYMAFSSDKLIRKIIIFIISLLAAFPLSMPRFMVAAFYIPIMLLVFPWLKAKANLQLSLIFGLLFVFPLLNSFRAWSNLSRINILDGFNALLEGHFDSYQSFCRVLQMDLTTWGNQLLGPLLFFVPRSVWPEKPIGSGAEMAKIANLSFPNIAANWYAEGYINFGFFGVLIFCIVMAYFCGKFDFVYRTLSYEFLSPFHLMYFVTAGYLFFVLRGDLMSGVSFGVGLGCAFFVVLLIARKFSKNNA